MPARRALVIGIDAYEAPWKLNGCVNDARVMAGILRDKFDFPEVGVRLLIDAEATKDAILDAFDDLIDATKTDDVVVFYFAGHGSQLEALEKTAKASGYTTGLCPVDVTRPGPELYFLVDDEIHERLLDLADRTSFITMIVDACHSGTVTRDAFGDRVRSMPTTRNVAGYALHTKPRRNAARTASAAEKGPSGWFSLSDKYVLIAGCRDEELSNEFSPGDSDETHGALTYFLSQELSRATSGMTYRDVFERAAANVTARKPLQHPQMEGRIDRAVFGVHELSPMDFAKVISRADDRATLNRGAAHGVTVGSTYEVYAQGTKQRGSAPQLGRLEIVSVGAVQSVARVDSETAVNAIGADARAFELTHARGTLTKLVDIVASGDATPTAARLRSEIERSPILEAPTRGSARAAFARAYFVAPREAAGPSDPVPQLGALAVPTWAVVDASGQLLMPPKPAGDEALIRENLEKVARYVQALELENPNPRSALRAKFTLDVMRRAADGTWVVAEPEAAGGLPVFSDGDAFGFRIMSNHGEAAFISVLDFQEGYALEPLFPPTGAMEKIAAGKTFEQGTVPAGTPDEWVLRGSFADGQMEQRETIKLFVTSTPADFSVLAQAGTRAFDATDRSPITTLFRMAIGTSADTVGAGARAVVRANVADEDPDDWTTVTRTFVIRRKPLIEAPAVHTGSVSDHEALGALGDAIAETGGQIARNVRLEEGRIAPSGTSEVGARVFQVDIPASDNAGHLLVRTDDDGLITFHFPEPATTSRSLGDSSPQTLTFRVPITPQAEIGTRGALSAIANFASDSLGSQVMTLIVYPAVGGLIGKIGEDLAQTWESSARPYRVRRMSPDDYTRSDAPALDAEGWKHVSAGRTLLLLHDTFDRSHGGFAGLPRSAMADLDRLYQGRVLAFDHFTLSHDPRRNAKVFIDAMQLSPGANLDVDIVAHGRGGLVARSLVEGGSESIDGADRLTVRKVVFVGTPNAGTPFADVQNIERTLNHYTLMAGATLTHFGGPIAGGLFAAAKSAAFRMAAQLKGVSAMKPGGVFLDSLKIIPAGPPPEHPPRYLAIASDFEPQEPGLARRLRKLIADKAIVGAHDLIVSTKSATETPARFPIVASHVLAQSEGVAHGGYFANSSARARILAWLREE